MKNKAFNTFLVSIGVVFGCVVIAFVWGIPTNGTDDPAASMRIGAAIFVAALLVMLVSAVVALLARKRQ